MHDSYILIAASRFILGILLRCFNVCNGFQIGLIKIRFFCAIANTLFLFFMEEFLINIVFNQLKISEEDFFKLVLINEKLWKIEDEIRDMERNKTYDIEFIKLARSVYFTNDVRAEIKKEINLKYGSLFVEEKSYSKY